MNHNLATPWGDGTSNPATPFLAFYSPQSSTMLFDSEQSITVMCQAGLRASSLTWTLHRNGFAKEFRSGKAEAFPGNLFRIILSTEGLHPGFYDLRVTLDSGRTEESKDALQRRPVRGVFVFGWKALEMPVAKSRPADFKAFWDKAKAEVNAIPLDAKEGPMETFDNEQINAYNVASACLPPDFDPDGHRAEVVESCKVNFAGPMGPAGDRIYGWLARPKTSDPKQKFPAMLVLPGGGAAARPRPLDHARHGYLALDIQIHGQDVDLETYTVPEGYYGGVIYDPVDKNYYYNVHLRVVQALNYLASRDDVDTSRIVVVGGSQGGRLGVVAAGLDSRIAAVVPAISHNANWPYLCWSKRLSGYETPLSWYPDPKLPAFDGMDVAGAPPTFDEPYDRCNAYYDPMNFALDATCPAFFNAGLIDNVSPPYSIFSVYINWGGANKTMVPIYQTGHDWSAEFDRRAYRWLDEVLKLGVNN